MPNWAGYIQTPEKEKTRVERLDADLWDAEQRFTTAVELHGHFADVTRFCWQRVKELRRERAAAGSAAIVIERPVLTMLSQHLIDLAVEHKVTFEALPPKLPQYSPTDRRFQVPTPIDFWALRRGRIVGINTQKPFTTRTYILGLHQLELIRMAPPEESFPTIDLVQPSRFWLRASKLAPLATIEAWKAAKANAKRWTRGMREAALTSLGGHGYAGLPKQAREDFAAFLANEDFWGH